MVTTPLHVQQIIVVQEEVQGAIGFFSRSVQSYNVRYNLYLGDGDAKGLSAVEEIFPYGNNCAVTISKSA